MQTKQDPIMNLGELSWYNRAQIKNAQPHENIIFCSDRWDFLCELLPFNGHPLWEAASLASRKIVASYGWIMYNMRTVCIETKIVSPLCYKIIDDKSQLTNGLFLKRTISQTLADESYHTLLSIDGIKAITEKRNLEEIKFPELNLIKKYNNYLSLCNTEIERDIAQMSLVIASEVMISDYLSLLATSEKIQPLCKIITNTHWKDELSHANTFKRIAEKITLRIEKNEKDFLFESIIKSSEWFLDKELETWLVILKSADIHRADEIINDCLKWKNMTGRNNEDKKILSLIQSLKNTKYTTNCLDKQELISTFC